MIISAHDGTLESTPRRKQPPLPNTQSLARIVTVVGMYLGEWPVIIKSQVWIVIIFIKSHVPIVFSIVLIMDAILL